MAHFPVKYLQPLLSKETCYLCKLPAWQLDPLQGLSMKIWEIKKKKKKKKNGYGNILLNEYNKDSRRRGEDGGDLQEEIERNKAKTDFRLKWEGKKDKENIYHRRKPWDAAEDQQGRDGSCREQETENTSAETLLSAVLRWWREGGGGLTVNEWMGNQIQKMRKAGPEGEPPLPTGWMQGEINQEGTQGKVLTQGRES